jgi:hypothetical protein
VVQILPICSRDRGSAISLPYDGVSPSYISSGNGFGIAVARGIALVSPSEKKVVARKRGECWHLMRGKDARWLVRSVVHFIVPESECNELREKETESHAS